ncbi:MAG: hypothetical protein IJW35_01855 [Lentisphaeria bacterium]|nr:hypothetical protein [Lentisphaeria bacterium]
MWKKFLIMCSAAAAGIAGAAVPGEIPKDVNSKVEWVKCAPMPLGKVDKEKHPHIPELRGVVFLYTRADESDSMIAMLENARRGFNGKVLIAVVTPDNMPDAEALQERHRDVRVRIGVDLERKIIPEFMRGGNMILPAGFLLDRDGRVLWRGEAVDLPEAAGKALAGKLDKKVQQEVFTLTDQLQRSLREGNMVQMLRQAERIFAVEPGNPSALRMAVFAAESLRNEKLAWDLTMRQLQQCGDQPRVSFTALELILRHRSLRQKLPELIRDFAKRPYLPRMRYAFADLLLSHFQFDIDAVLGAKQILAGTPLALNAQPEEMAVVLALRARLFYALGDLAGAEAAQAEAVQLYSRSPDRAGRQNAEKMLKFFRTLLQEAKK